MLLEHSGICQHCAGNVRILVYEGELLAPCPLCGEQPFSVRKKAGIVYVISNENQTGVKIGLTKKSISQRIRGLNTPGVPGKFVPIAIFPSDRPEIDEKKVHEKLKRKKLAKEHFDVSPIEGVLAASRALNRRQPIFFDQKIEKTFKLELKKAKIEMEIRIGGKNQG